MFLSKIQQVKNWRYRWTDSDSSSRFPRRSHFSSASEVKKLEISKALILNQILFHVFSFFLQSQKSLRAKPESQRGTNPLQNESSGSEVRTHRSAAGSPGALQVTSYTFSLISGRPMLTRPHSAADVWSQQASSNHKAGPGVM